MSSSNWPGRAEAAFKLVVGKLTFAGMPRPRFRARREGQLLAGTVGGERQLSGIINLNDS